MGRKVKVVTKCGEEHIYKFDQDVETVEILKDSTLKKLEDFAVLHQKAKDICYGLSCGDDEGCPLSFGYSDDHSKPPCIVSQLCKLPAYKEIS